LLAAAAAAATCTAPRPAPAQNRVDLKDFFQFERGVSYSVSLHSELRSVIRLAADSAAPSHTALLSQRHVPVTLVAHASTERPSHRARLALESMDRSQHSSHRVGLLAFGLAGCSATQTSAVTNSHAAFTAGVNRIMSGYFNPGCTGSYSTYFGAYDATRYNTVKSHFASILALSLGESRRSCRRSAALHHPRSLCAGQMGGGSGGNFYTFNCAPSATDCGGDSTFAFVYPDDTTYTVNLCNGFWGGAQALQLEDTQVSTAR
jgi:hypothetical protein